MWWVDSWRHIHWLGPRSRAIFSHPAAPHWLPVRSDASLQWAGRPEPDHISDPAPWWEVTQLAGCRRFNSSPGHPSCSASSAPRTHARHPPSHAPCVHILTTARAPHSRAQTSGGGHRPTPPPLPLRPAPLLVGRQRGGRSRRCGASSAACAMRRMRMCRTHVHGSPR